MSCVSLALEGGASVPQQACLLNAVKLLLVSVPVRNLGAVPLWLNAPAGLDTPFEGRLPTCSDFRKCGPCSWHPGNEDQLEFQHHCCRAAVCTSTSGCGWGSAAWSAGRGRQLLMRRQHQRPVKQRQQSVRLARQPLQRQPRSLQNQWWRPMPPSLWQRRPELRLQSLLKGRRLCGYRAFSFSEFWQQLTGRN